MFLPRGENFGRTGGVLGTVFAYEFYHEEKKVTKKIIFICGGRGFTRIVKSFLTLIYADSRCFSPMSNRGRRDRFH